MLQDAAINWVRSNCTVRKLSWDVKEHIESAVLKNTNCSFVIGGSLTRSRAPFLLHCFAGELFLFQLTAAQARELGVAPDSMACKLDPVPDPARPAMSPVISIEQFELRHPVLSETVPICGRIKYKCSSFGQDAWCVRLDYYLGSQRATHWCHPLPYPLSHVGDIDVEFQPIAPGPNAATAYKGPVAMFVHFSRKPVTIPNHPLSSCVGAMAELI